MPMLLRLIMNLMWGVDGKSALELTVVFYHYVVVVVGFVLYCYFVVVAHAAAGSLVDNSQYNHDCSQ